MSRALPLLLACCLCGCFPAVSLDGVSPGGEDDAGWTDDSGGGGSGSGAGSGSGGTGGEPGVCQAWEDLDGDGYGAGVPVEVDCEDWPEGTVDNDLDCDDTDDEVNPEGVEVCDDQDNDCDGLFDDDDDSLDPSGALELYADTDGDGFGDPESVVWACAEGPGAVADDSDCDDSDAGVNPEATETCNGSDDDCDGTSDSSEVCPCDLDRQGDHTYLFCTEGLDWLDAEASCADLEGYLLVVVDDEAEQSWLAEQVGDRSWWEAWSIGYHNQGASEGQEPGGGWEWVDGSSGGYESWSDDWPFEQPDDADGNEDCAVLDGYDGSWSDVACDSDGWLGPEQPFVCESTVGS